MRKVTILNGIMDDRYSEFENKLKQYAEQGADQIRLDLFRLRDMDIKYCTGCWNCWVKTPGICVHNDQMADILKSVINSDLTIFLSPVVMGFVSKYIKKTCDRMIPLVHPYIGIFHNECHHYKRYKRYPKLGMLLLEEEGEHSAGVDESDFEIITGIYRRMAINLRTELAFSIVTNGDLEVLKNEVDNI